MTGKEYFEKYKKNPSSINFNGEIYTEQDLATMDNDDYNEVMEFGECENSLV